MENLVAGKERISLFLSYFGGLDVVACGRLLRPNSTPPPLSPSLLIPLLSLPFAHSTSQGLCSYCSQEPRFLPAEAMRPCGSPYKKWVE